MLKLIAPRNPHWEMAAAMGLKIDESIYEVDGTKTQKITQIGDAASVAKMKACVGAIMSDAAPKSRATAEAESGRRRNGGCACQKLISAAPEDL